MSLGTELLDEISQNGVAVASVDPSTEEHIVVNDNRFISVPSSLKRIAVQFDHDVETVTFDCPRYWDGLDMSAMAVYINYMLPNKAKGYCIAKNVIIDESDSNVIHFDWTIGNGVTYVSGPLSFLICIKKTNSQGEVINHWNSELNTEMYISDGLECDDPYIPDFYKDVVTDLLVRMNTVEVGFQNNNREFSELKADVNSYGTRINQANTNAQNALNTANGVSTEFSKLKADVNSYSTRINQANENAQNALDIANSVNAAIDKKSNISDIVNNLTSTSTDKPLSANQGKVINESITNIKKSYKMEYYIGTDGFLHVKYKEGGIL